MIPWRKNNTEASAAPATGAGHRYVFVSGHPRSGTNWVSSLLNLHPDCFCDGEFHFLILRWAMDGFTSLPWYLGALEPQKSVAEESFQQLVRNCLIERATIRCAGRASEKNPPRSVGVPGGPPPSVGVPGDPSRSAGVPGGRPRSVGVPGLPAVLGDHTPRLFRIMISPPEARYIVIQRDGRDVLVSYTFHLLNTKAPDVIPEHIRAFFQARVATLDGSAEAHAAAGVALLNHEPWVRHYANFWSEHILHDHRIWQSVASQGFGGYVKFVKYEALRADVEGVRREIYEHLGLEAGMAAAVSAETNTAPGFGGREDVKSFYRKGEAGDWRRYFTPEMGRWFHETAGAAMARAGYEADGVWVGGIGTGIATDSQRVSARGAQTEPARVSTTTKKTVLNT